MLFKFPLFFLFLTSQSASQFVCFFCPKMGVTLLFTQWLYGVFKLGLFTYLRNSSKLDGNNKSLNGFQWILLNIFEAPKETQIKNEIVTTPTSKPWELYIYGFICLTRNDDCQLDDDDNDESGEKSLSHEPKNHSSAETFSQFTTYPILSTIYITRCHIERYPTTFLWCFENIVQYWFSKSWKNVHISTRETESYLILHMYYSHLALLQMGTLLLHSRTKTLA